MNFLIYNYILVWLFIMLTLFTVVFMYAKTLQVINQLVDQKKRKLKQKEIDISLDYIKRKITELEKLSERLRGKNG